MSKTLSFSQGLAPGSALSASPPLGQHGASAAGDEERAVFVGFLNAAAGALQASGRMRPAETADGAGDDDAQAKTVDADGDARDLALLGGLFGLLSAVPGSTAVGGQGVPADPGRPVSGDPGSAPAAATADVSAIVSGDTVDVPGGAGLGQSGLAGLVRTWAAQRGVAPADTAAANASTIPSAMADALAAAAGQGGQPTSGGELSAAGRAALEAVSQMLVARGIEKTDSSQAAEALGKVAEMLQARAGVEATTASAAPLSAVGGAAAGGAAAAASAAAGSAANVPGPALSLMAADFVGDLSNRIEWQLDKGIHEARIRLHPAELGALTVRVTTQGDQAQVHIVAAEAATRTLLSQAMPQLRELLGGSGLNLTRGDVDSGQQRGGGGGRGSSRGHGDAEPVASGDSLRRRVVSVSLLDAYA